MPNVREILEALKTNMKQLGYPATMEHIQMYLVSLAESLEGNDEQVRHDAGALLIIWANR